MKLSGNNTLTLCGAALCEIVEKHFADSYYNNEPKVRVNYVRFDNSQHTATFDLTTDAGEKGGRNG